MEHPGQIEGLSAQAAKIVAPETPIPMKMMAASGLAPLPSGDMLSVLYLLSYDSDATLAGKAKASIGKIPANILVDALTHHTSPFVLDGSAHNLLTDLSAVEQIILNRHTAGDTIIWLSEKLTSERLLEMIAANEQRMLAYPRIIEVLYLNSAARMSTVDRAVELAVRNGIELQGISAFEEVKKAIQGQLIVEPSGDNEPLPEDMEFSSALQTDLRDAVDEAIVSDVFEALEAGKDARGSDEEKKVADLAVTLSNLTISQKIRVATLGNASQRAILIRDSNKLVIMAVLKSPALNDSEIMRYSAARSLPEEAIRYITSKRDWTKHYQVKLNLVNNPKTHIAEALRFLNHLRPNDLRGLERSKDVTGVVKNAARELRRKRSE